MDPALRVVAMPDARAEPSKAVAALAFFVALALPPAVSGDREAAQMQEVLERYSWPIEAGPRGSTRGMAVSMVRRTPDCIAARLLLRTPQWDLVILGFGFEVGRGVVEASFDDVLADWHFEERQQTSLTFPSAAAALDQATFLEGVGDVMSAGRAAVPVVVLTASGGSRLEVTVDGPGERLDEEVRHAIAADGFGWELRRTAPDGLHELVRTVRAMVCDASGRGRFCSFGGLLGTLDDALSSSRRPGVEVSPPLRLSDAILERAAQELVFDAEDRRFLALFPHFRPDDPFAGTCASGQPIEGS